MVGVNNRNLGTFHTDVVNSYRLASLLPKDYLLVSESGISNPQTVRELREAGFRGFLIGETFMKTPNPGSALRTFIEEVTK
jgi:indole-3-glycerol phosphate synthase